MARPTQHLNLIDAALLPQRLRYSAAQVMLVAALLLGSSALAALGLKRAAADTQAQTQALALAQDASAAALAPAASAAADIGALQAEITQLRAMLAAQDRVRGALDAGAAGSVTGHGEYFVALARQAQAQVWITGFTVDADGHGLTLEGRMSDAAMLPGYLRKLNDEPRFRGRPFAQLQMRAVRPEGGQASPYVEFALRSQPVGDAR